MLIYNGQIIAGGGTIVLPMTRAEYEANKAILDNADVWVDLTDEPDQVAEADQIAYSVGGVQKSMGYIGDIATKAIAKVEPSDTALYLHEVGEYFINKDGNTCKVDSQIPVNGTITLGTNCHVLPKGVANALVSAIADAIADAFKPQYFSLTWNEHVVLNKTRLTAFRMNNLVVITAYFETDGTVLSSSEILATVPGALKPQTEVQGTGMITHTQNGVQISKWTVRTTGKIQQLSTNSLGTINSFTFVYPINN